MDLWDPQRDWQGEAWQRVQAKVLLFGISSDVLFPDAEVKCFAEELRSAGVDCRYESIESAHGHDSFLAEPDKLVHLLREFVGWEAPLGASFRNSSGGEGLKQAGGNVA